MEKIINMQARTKKLVRCCSDGRYGNWGICYTYGTYFALKGLASVGKTYRNSRTVRKACEFLLSKQHNSGGWGESYLSCANSVNTPLRYIFVHAVPSY
jgi:squalene cyclase